MLICNINTKIPSQISIIMLGQTTSIYIYKGEYLLLLCYHMACVKFPAFEWFCAFIGTERLVYLLFLFLNILRLSFYITVQAHWRICFIFFSSSNFVSPQPKSLDNAAVDQVTIMSPNCNSDSIKSEGICMDSLIFPDSKC